MKKILTGGIVAGVIAVIAFVVTIFIASRTDEYVARVLLEGSEAADEWVRSLSIIVALIAFALVFLLNVFGRKR